jgi:hypothetical protein
VAACAPAPASIINATVAIAPVTLRPMHFFISRYPIQSSTTDEKIAALKRYAPMKPESYCKNIAVTAR